MNLLFRSLQSTDSMTELTELLHEAYGALARDGMNYLASRQPEAVTRKRCRQGETLVAELDGKIVATVTLIPPEKTKGCPWYDEPFVAKFGQFAVSPRLQGTGIGSRLMDLIEARACELGAKELALDTSERALHLIEIYSKRGYRFIEYTQWEGVNYRSVVLSKPLI